MMIRKTIIKLKHLLNTKINSYSMNSLLIVIFVISLSTISCEDVIELDLNTVEPRIVIEGSINDRWEQYNVTISKTGDYFEPGIFPRVPGAIVTISDDRGNLDTLQEIEPGLHQSDTLRGSYEVTYTLNVDVDGENYTASTTMPLPLRLYSTGFYFQSAGGFVEEDNYVIQCRFEDRPGIDDYCRFVVYQNGVLLEDYFLYDGQWSDGNKINYEINGFDAGDTVIVKFQCFDKQMFDYFLTLSAVVATDENQESNWSPANPNTNLSNNALGYFGAFTERTYKKILPSGK